MVLELERRLRVSEPVIKFITVRMDEEEKRLAKVKALRGSRRKVSSERPHVRRPAAAAGPRACGGQRLKQGFRDQRLRYLRRQASWSSNELLPAQRPFPSSG